MTTMLTKNFSLHELTYSANAKKAKVDNTPNDEQIENLRRLCVHVLQPLRERLGKPVTVTSGYRNPAVNKMARGVWNSDHLTGCAADVTVKGMTNLELCQLVRRLKLPVHQAIQEGHWTHLSHRPDGNDGEFLTAHFDAAGDATYSRGLRKS